MALCRGGGAGGCRREYEEAAYDSSVRSYVHAEADEHEGPAGSHLLLSLQPSAPLSPSFADRSAQ